MMRRRRQRGSYSTLETVVRLLVVLLGVGTALVALLRALDPHWMDLWAELARRLLTRNVS